MYKRKTQGWMKHLDFIFWDVIGLHLAYMLAYLIRYNAGSPYADPEYLSMAVVLTVVNILVAVLFDTMHNILQRDRWMELVSMIKHAIFVYSLYAGDVHWCVNAKGIKGVSCPSKYYGLAAAGRPILGVLEKDTEIRRIIEETKGGLVCDPGDYRSVAENISWFISHADSEMLTKMGEKGRTHLCKHFTKEISIRKYIDAISDCCSDFD